MERMDDGKLVQIKMGELRRLQKLDREVLRLRARSQVLEDTFRRIHTGHGEAIKLIASVLQHAEWSAKQAKEEEAKHG